MAPSGISCNPHGIRKELCVSSYIFADNEIAKHRQFKQLRITYNAFSTTEKEYGK